MTTASYLGIDPGPTTGLVLWTPGDTPYVAQCNAVAADAVVRGLLETIAYGWPVWAQVEKFVVRRAATKAGAAGAATRELIADLVLVLDVDPRVQAVRQRSAAEVKPWATDHRLAAAGLLDACTGMGHARDAARYALFTACKDGGHPDPLSRKARP